MQLANPSAALPLLREAVSTEVTYLQGQLPLLPEGLRLDLVAVFGDRWQIPFLQAQQSEAGAELALFTRLNGQGLLQDIQRSQALLSRKEQLEQALYRQLPQIQPRLVEPAQIAALLSPGSVLVKCQRYRCHDGSPEQFGPPRYLALLLRPDGTIRAIGLGEAAPIDAAVSRLDLAPLQRELAGSCPTPGYPWRARSRRRGSCTSPPWLLVGGSSPGERRRKGRGDRSHQPRRPRPAAPQRPGIRRRQPAPANRVDDSYLSVAGARSSLLSLWKVDEGHARSFLERNYSLLKAGKGRADALLQTPKGVSRRQKLQLQRHPGVGRLPAQRRLASPARVVRQPKAR
jgi:hypothetical protein